MNKIKFLYDVVKTMRDKTVFKGFMKAEVQKDQQKVFTFQNEFEKDLATGHTKAKITSELDCQGKLMKHNSHTEFVRPELCEIGHHAFRHWHHHNPRHGCLKSKLAKLTFVLSLLNNLTIEECENQTTLISLSMKEMPEDLKTLIQTKLDHHAELCQHGKHHLFVNEFCAMETMDFVLNIFVNKNLEVETASICLDGTRSDEENTRHALKAIGELSFAW